MRNMICVVNFILFHQNFSYLIIGDKFGLEAQILYLYKYILKTPQIQLYILITVIIPRCNILQCRPKRFNISSL